MLHILGMGCCHPTTRITNEFLENLGIESSAQWIVEKIGIEERLTCLPLDYIRDTHNQDPRQAVELLEMTPTQMGVRAAEQAIERAGVAKEDIGLVIGNCCTPLQTIPAEAQRVAGELGLKVPAFDVMSACPAFATHLDYINSLRPERLPSLILCISTGTMTAKVNYRDRSDSAIWGDGAAAWLVSAECPGKLAIVDTFFTADTLRHQAVCVDTLGFFHQDGRAVRHFSVIQTVRMLKSLEKRFALNWERDVFIGHQANGTMLRQIADNRQIPDSNHWTNVRFKGNQGGASAPAVAAENWDRFTPGQYIAIAVVGAGLSWGSVLLQVQPQE